MPTIFDYIARINQHILNPLIILLFAVAVMMLIWGINEFIEGVNTDDGRAKGKRHIVWGLVGMFVMISVYGIIRLIINTFGIEPPSGGFPFLP